MADGEGQDDAHGLRPTPTAAGSGFFRNGESPCPCWAGRMTSPASFESPPNVSAPASNSETAIAAFPSPHFPTPLQDRLGASGFKPTAKISFKRPVPSGCVLHSPRTSADRDPRGLRGGTGPRRRSAGGRCPGERDLHNRHRNPYGALSAAAALSDPGGAGAVPTDGMRR